MFNERGELIAITASKITDADNMGFGIPVDTLKKVLENIEVWTALFLMCSVIVAMNSFPKKMNIALVAVTSCRKKSLKRGD